MKQIIILTTATLLSACGSSDSSDCSKSPLVNRIATFQNVQVSFNKNCTYSVPACVETGTYKDSGNNSVTFYPEKTQCGGTESATCDYAISGSQIGIVCK